MPPCIKTKGLTKRFGRHMALNNVSIEVPPGEVMGLSG
jgi:ABC-type multidrug transport system ATPase subunit